MTTAAVLQAHHNEFTSKGINVAADLGEEHYAQLASIIAEREKLAAEIAALKNEIESCDKELQAIDHARLSASTVLVGQPDPARVLEEAAEALKNKANTGRMKFNMDPFKGVEWLIENGVLSKDSDDVAKYLYEEGEGLRKKAIGEYLGKNKPFNLDVLTKFVALHKFEGLTFDQALRKFLVSFRLPGEAQQIDRIMERFASRYHGENPAVFVNADTAYVLAFSVVMLNTDLHNPSVKNKMTKDGFIRNNRGINDGKDLPREFLEALYDGIRNEEIKKPADEEEGSDLWYVTFFNPEREGWLTKQGGRQKNWKRRWFRLTNNCLYYFKNPEDTQPIGIIPLENLGVRDVSAKYKKPYLFEIFSPSNTKIKACKTTSNGTLVEGRHDHYLVCAANADEENDWIQSINAYITNDPVLAMMRAKKAAITHEY
eukprot:Opistho-2@89685